MLRIENIRKSFNGYRAVTNVSFTVNRGELGCIIGPNGAGKTTLFNIISGHLRPDSGKVYLDDTDITGLPSHKICQRGVGRSFQITNIFPRLSVFENIQIAVLSWKKKTRDMFGRTTNLFLEEASEIIESVDLSEKRNEMAGMLSYGDQRRLDVGLALASRPTLLLLDEPTAGMSPAETEGTVALVLKLAKEHEFTLLFVEHDLHAVFTMSEKIRVLNNGYLIAEGTPEDIRENEEVQRVYLGG